MVGTLIRHQTTLEKLLVEKNINLWLAICTEPLWSCSILLVESDINLWLAICTEPLWSCSYRIGRERYKLRVIYLDGNRYQLTVILLDRTVINSCTLIGTVICSSLSYCMWIIDFTSVFLYLYDTTSDCLENTKYYHIWNYLLLAVSEEPLS